jgi:hypothetical protein
VEKRLKGELIRYTVLLNAKMSLSMKKRIINEQFYLFVDKQLKTNRKILKRYNQSGFTTLRKDVLMQEGFNPKFFTHYWKNKKGQVYLFCYDYGFLDLKDSGKAKYLIVEWQKYME